MTEARAGRVFVRNLLNLRARYYPNGAGLARAHQLMDRDRPFFFQLALRLENQDRNPNDPVHRVGEDSLLEHTPSLVREMFAHRTGLLELLRGVRALQDASAALPNISCLSEAGEERFCRPLVYIEGNSVRILCRSYGIHIWMLETMPGVNP